MMLSSRGGQRVRPWNRSIEPPVPCGCRRIVPANTFQKTLAILAPAVAVRLSQTPWPYQEKGEKLTIGVGNGWHCRRLKPDRPCRRLRPRTAASLSIWAGEARMAGELLNVAGVL